MKHFASFEKLKLVTIGTTEKCNLSCVMCLFNGPNNFVRKEKTLTADQVKKFIDGLWGGGVEIWFFGTGEFLMDKNAVDYIRYAKESGHIPCVLTNGQLLSREMTDKLLNAGCEKFAMSADVIGAEEYARIRRGGDFNKILEALDYLKSRKTEYPEIITEIRNVLLSEYSEDTIDEYCRFWNGKTDLLTWGALIDDNLILQNLVYERPEERCGCELGMYLLPSGHLCPCCAITFHDSLNKVEWLPHIDSFTPAEAWDYFNELYNTENSPLRNICENCDFWLQSYRDETGNTPYFLQIKLENAAPSPNLVLYKKEMTDLKNGLQYNRNSIIPHVATSFFPCPLAENRQELFVTIRFEKPGNPFPFTVVVQNALYDQLAIKTVKNTGNAEVHLTIGIYRSSEELRLVFYAESGTIDDFLPVFLEITSSAVSREFLRYIKLKAEVEKLKNNAVPATGGNTILQKGKRFLKRLKNG